MPPTRLSAKDTTIEPLTRATTAEPRVNRTEVIPEATVARWELAAMVAIVVAFTAAGLGLILVGASLGHDEAVYALRARAFALGEPYRFFWRDYRAPGLPGVLSLLWTIRPTEPYLRAAVLGFGGLGVIATWWLGRHLFDRTTGVIAAALVACMPGYLVASTQVWPDVPGAVLGLGAILVFAAASAGQRVRWWALLTVVPAAAATVVRYGAPVPIGVGCAVVALCRWPAVRRSLPQTLLTALLTALACLAVLLVPWLTGSVVAPWVAINALQGGQDFPFYRSFVDFSGQIPQLLGAVVGPLVLTGLGLLFWRSRRHALSRGPLSIASAAAVGTLLGLALVLRHGELRYLMPVVPWVAVLGGAGLAGVPSLVGRAARPVVAGLALLLGLAALATGFLSAREPHVAQKRALSVLRAASVQMDRRAEGSCAVVTSYVPQVAWYSGCETGTPISPSSGGPRPTDSVLDSFPPNEQVFVLLLQGGKRQLEGAALQAYLARSRLVGAIGDPREGRLRYAEFYEVTER